MGLLEVGVVQLMLSQLEGFHKPSQLTCSIALIFCDGPSVLFGGPFRLFGLVAVRLMARLSRPVGAGFPRLRSG
jgi:hypothetical protein